MLTILVKGLKPTNISACLSPRPKGAAIITPNFRLGKRGTPKTVWALTHSNETFNLKINYA
jgi:hypothetical protein